MALSYYSNWESFQQFDSDMDIYDSELRALADAWNYDYFVDPNDLFYSENCNSLLYDDFSNGVPFENINSTNAEEPFLLHQEFEPLHYPKRQKGCDFEEVYSDHLFKPAFFNGFVPNPCLLQDFSPPEVVVPPLPDFPTAPPCYTNGSCHESVKKEPSGGSLSAQSVAARQRRRKITEKTQELGKLVPGGQKMNTAEMLQAAYKYIKYLQAQVGVLEFIRARNQENAEVALEIQEEFQVLLESTMIQEKLYSTENCLVPQKFVQELRGDHKRVESNPHLIPTVKQEH